MYRNLVFEGGGVKGTAYVGALKALEEEGVLQNITSVAGTSAGAITALLVALNYSVSEIHDIVFNSNLKALSGSGNILRIPIKYGIHNGDNLYQWFKDLIKQKTGDEDSTFQILKDKGFKELRVISTNLNKKGIEVFSAAQTPNIPVADAIRASMSIPIYFDSFRVRGYNDLYVDGGMLWNFPLTIFDQYSLNKETLGLCLWDYKGFGKTSDVTYNNILPFIGSLFETILEGQSDLISEDEDNKFRTIKIDDLGISATDFDITEDQKQKLYDCGYNYTKDFLKINLVN